MPMVVVLLAFLVAGCSSEAMIDRFSRPDERAVAEASIEELRAGQWSTLERRLPLFQTLDADTRTRMRALLPVEGVPKLVGVRFRQDVATKLRLAEYVYGLDDRSRHALAVVVIAHPDKAAPQLAGLRVVPTDLPTDSLGRFRLRDAGAGGIVVLLLQLAALAVTAAALWKVWRSGLFRRRWLWTLGCLIGIFMVSAPWAGTTLNFQPFFVQLVSVGVFKAGPLAPWMMRVSLPLVAIVALLRRRSDVRHEPTQTES